MDIDSRIKCLVINKLGCNCSPEVFNVINWGKDTNIDRNIKLDYRINIGNRLLIYIISMDDAEFLKNNLWKIITRGIDERNDNRFNRFRLVIISNNMDEINYTAENEFDKLNIDDPKVHLHVIQKKDFDM